MYVLIRHRGGGVHVPVSPLPVAPHATARSAVARPTPHRPAQSATAPHPYVAAPAAPAPQPVQHALRWMHAKFRSKKVRHQNFFRQNFVHFLTVTRRRLFLLRACCRLPCQARHALCGRLPPALLLLPRAQRSCLCPPLPCELPSAACLAWCAHTGHARGCPRSRLL